MPTGSQRAEHGTGPKPNHWRSVDDAELVEACLEGDQDAWTALVRRYERLVFSIPRRYGFSTAACEDVFQEVFVIVVGQLRNIRNRAGLPKWFITTTHRVCRQVADRTPPLVDASVLALLGAPDPDEVDRIEMQHLIRVALGRLDARCEELVSSLYVAAVRPSYEELARRLGIPLGSIGPTRARCLAALMEILTRLDDGGVLET